MRKIGIFFAPANQRSRIVANAMAAGCQKLGVPHDLLSSMRVGQNAQYETVMFYGLAQGLRRIFERYRTGKKTRAVYIDLGYWGRHKRTRWDGYHKLSLNDRHPTAYFQRRFHTDERFRQFGVEIKPWRKDGRHIIVAGMSAKAAAAEGFQPHQWERTTITRLRELTDRPIYYRPKPNWLEAKPIPGSHFRKDHPLETELIDCHAVVTHHSNVAIDALLAGIPCVCPRGVGSVISCHDLDQIENLPTPAGREQWAADIAWTQWSIEEMHSGAAYRYLLDEGLVP